MVPWGLAEPTYIKQVVDGGHALAPHWKVPQPHYDLIKMGLQARARDRRSSMQNLYDTMRSHGKVCLLLISSLSDGVPLIDIVKITDVQAYSTLRRVGRFSLHLCDTFVC